LGIANAGATSFSLSSATIVSYSELEARVYRSGAEFVSGECCTRPVSSVLLTSEEFRHDYAMTGYRTNEQLEAGVPYAGDESAYLFTVVLSLLIGVALVWILWRGRQIWLLTWSAGLIIASIAYLTWVVVR